MAKKLVITVEAKDQVTNPIKRMVKGVLGFGSGVLRVEKMVVGGVQKMVKNLFTLKKAILGLAVVIVMRRIAGSFNEAATELDRLAKTARQFQIPVEQYSALEFAAERSGVAVEVLSQSIRTLDTRLGQVAMGGGGEAAKAFKRLEQAGADLSLKGVARFRSVIDALAGMTDQSEKLAVASVVLGEDAAAQLLRFGHDLGALIAEADRFGTITRAQTAAAEAYRDSVTNLSRAWLFFRASIIQVVAPAITDLMNGLAEATKRSGELVAAIMRMIRQAFGSGEEGRQARMFIERLQGNLGDLIVTMVTHLVAAAVTTFVELLPTAATIIASQAGGAIAKAVISAYASAMKGTVSVLQASVSITNPMVGQLTKNIADAADAAISAMEQTTKVGVDATVAHLSDLDREMAAISAKLAGQTTDAVADIRRSWGELNLTLEQTKKAFGETEGGSIFRLEGLAPALQSAGQQMAQFRENFRQMVEVGQNRSSLHSFFNGLQSILPNTTRQMGEFGAKLKAAMGPQAAQSIQSSASALAMLFRLMNQPPPLGWVDGLKAGLGDFKVAAENTFGNARDMAFAVAAAFTQGLTSAIFDAIEGVKSLKEAFKDFAKSFLRLVAEMIIQQLIARALGAAFPAPAPAGGAQGGVVSRGGIHHFARGGVVPGPDVRRDIVPAILAPREYVVRRQAVERLGVGTLHEINRTGRLPAQAPPMVFNLTMNVHGSVDRQTVPELERRFGEMLIRTLGTRPGTRDQVRGMLA